MREQNIVGEASHQASPKSSLAENKYDFLGPNATAAIKQLQLLFPEFELILETKGSQFRRRPVRLPRAIQLLRRL